MHEFWALVQSPAHWAFEILLMLVFDGLIGALAWPFLRKHWHHHLDHDRQYDAVNWPGAVPNYAPNDDRNPEKIRRNRALNIPPPWDL